MHPPWSGKSTAALCFKSSHTVSSCRDQTAAKRAVPHPVTLSSCAPCRKRTPATRALPWRALHSSGVHHMLPCTCLPKIVASTRCRPWYTRPAQARCSSASTVSSWSFQIATLSAAISHDKDELVRGLIRGGRSRPAWAAHQSRRPASATPSVPLCRHVSSPEAQRAGKSTCICVFFSSPANTRLCAFFRRAA